MHYFNLFCQQANPINVAGESINYRYHTSYNRFRSRYTELKLFRMGIPEFAESPSEKESRMNQRGRFSRASFFLISCKGENHNSIRENHIPSGITFYNIIGDSGIASVKTAIRYNNSLLESTCERALKVEKNLSVLLKLVLHTKHERINLSLFLGISGFACCIGWYSCISTTSVAEVAFFLEGSRGG